MIAFKVVDDISDDLVKRDNFFKIGAVLSTRGLVPWDMIDVDVLFVAFDFLKRFPLMPDLPLNPRYSRGLYLYLHLDLCLALHPR